MNLFFLLEVEIGTEPNAPILLAAPASGGSRSLVNDKQATYATEAKPTVFPARKKSFEDAKQDLYHAFNELTGDLSKLPMSVRAMCSDFAENAGQPDKVFGIVVLQHRGIYESLPLTFGPNRVAPTTGAILPLPFGIIIEKEGPKSIIIQESNLQTKNSNIKYSYVVAECKIDLGLIKNMVPGAPPILEQPVVTLILGVGSRSQESGTETSFSFRLASLDVAGNQQQLGVALIVENAHVANQIEPTFSISNHSHCTIL